MTHRKSFHRSALLLVSLIGLGVAARAEIIEQVLVRVNGEILTKTDLEARQIAALRQMGQQVDAKTDPSDAQLRTMLDEVTPALLVSVLDEMIVVQRGRELGYQMGEEQFKGILENIKKENKIESDAQFQAALDQEGMTLAELRKNLERQAIFSRVQQNEVLGRVAVSEDEARRYFDAHRSEFTSEPSITLREVLVAIPADQTAIATSEVTAREKATQIRQRALAGESFEKLAADLSDSPSRANAGLIGPLNMSDLSAELKTVIEGMKVGDITDLLRSPRGYQVLKLETSTPPTTRPFAQVRDEISNRLFTQKRQDEFQTYLEKLRAEAIIEWRNPELKKAYEQGLVRTKAAASAPASE